MKVACIALAAVLMSPALAYAAGPSGTAVPAPTTTPRQGSDARVGSPIQSAVKCADGSRSKSRNNACKGHGGIDKATLAAETEHASGGSNTASKGVLTTSKPPAKTASR